MICIRSMQRDLELCGLRRPTLLFLAHTDLTFRGSLVTLRAVADATTQQHVGRVYKTRSNIIGILSPPGDGMVIITLLTQVRKEKNGKINFRPGIECPTFDARTEVYLSILFLPHLCQQSNYYQEAIYCFLFSFS